MNFRISGLPIAPFQALLSATDEALAQQNIRVLEVDAPNAYPCRVTLQDAQPGERVLLLNYTHLPSNSPYAASGAIFIRCTASESASYVNEVPEQQRRRLLSVRAYDVQDMMIEAQVIEGSMLAEQIAKFWQLAQVSYLHVHNARQGCYACRVDRTVA
jgi:Protein of unknown function (DUF1203)